MSFKVSVVRGDTNQGGVIIKMVRGDTNQGNGISGDGVFKNLSSTYPTRGFVRYGNNNPFTFFW